MHARPGAHTHALLPCWRWGHGTCRGASVSDARCCDVSSGRGDGYSSVGSHGQNPNPHASYYCHSFATVLQLQYNHYRRNSDGSSAQNRAVSVDAGGCGATKKTSTCLTYLSAWLSGSRFQSRRQSLARLSLSGNLCEMAIVLRRSSSYVSVKKQSNPGRAPWMPWVCAGYPSQTAFQRSPEGGRLGGGCQRWQAFCWDAYEREQHSSMTDVTPEISEGDNEDSLLTKVNS